jgi:hypothetical protein
MNATTHGLFWGRCHIHGNMPSSAGYPCEAFGRCEVRQASGCMIGYRDGLERVPWISAGRGDAARRCLRQLTSRSVSRGSQQAQPAGPRIRCGCSVHVARATWLGHPRLMLGGAGSWDTRRGMSAGGRLGGTGPAGHDLQDALWPGLGLAGWVSGAAAGYARNPEPGLGTTRRWYGCPHCGHSC